LAKNELPGTKLDKVYKVITFMQLPLLMEKASSQIHFLLSREKAEYMVFTRGTSYMQPLPERPHR
jgi:hypothetical protein